MSQLPPTAVLAHRIRKPAILDEIELNQHTVIEASAGTGKTFTIEHLLVELLLRGEASIDEILVVTFTRRATGELKSRIRELLQRVLVRPAPEDEPAPGEPCWLIDEEHRKTLHDALMRFDLAPVYTIHGFCQRVLVEHAFEHQRLFEQSHAQDDPLFADTFHHLLRTTFSRDPELEPWLQAWLHMGLTVQALLEELLATHRARVPLAPMLAPRERMELLEQARAAALSGRGAPELTFLVKTATLQGFYPPLLAELRRRKAERGVFSYDDMLDMVWESLADPGRGFRLTNALRGRYRFALIDEFQDTDPVQWSIFYHLFVHSGSGHTLYLIGDPKQAIYAFRGADVHTYLRARDELVASGGKLLRLTDNYRSSASMIDAYNMIFDQADEGPLFTGDIRYEVPVRCGRPELRICGPAGEPEAAIHLLALQAPRQGKLRADLIRHTLAEAIAGEILRLLTPATALLVKAREGHEPQPVRPRDIFVLTRSGEESRTVARTLRRYGIPGSLFKEGGLFATAEALDALDLLRAVAEPHNASARFRAYLTPFFGLDVHELEAFDNADWELSGPRTVRQLLYGWHQLARGRHFDRLFTAILEQSGVTRRHILLEPDERALTNTTHIFEILAELAQKAALDIHDIVARLAGWIAGRDKPVGEDADLQRVDSNRDAVQIMTMHKSKGLEADVVFLFGGLTAHKGGRVHAILESGERVHYLSRGNLDPPTLKLVDQYQEHEAQRLMYVAVTRAAVRLYLPWIPKERGKRLFGYLNGDYAVLNTRLDTIVKRLDQLPPGLFALRPTEPVEPQAESGPPVAPQPLLLDWPTPEYVHMRAEPERAFKPLRERHLRVTSYTALKAAAAEPAAVMPFAPLSPVDEAELDLTADAPELGELPRGRDFGVIVHHLLEHLPLDAGAHAHDLDGWLELAPVRDTFQRAIDTLGVRMEHRAYCQRLCYNTLTAPLPLAEGVLLPSLAATAAAGREVEFAFPMPEADHPLLGTTPTRRLRVERGYIVGVIDLLFEYKGRIYFGDWKTDLIERYDPDALHHHVQAHYAVQARLYTLATLRLLGISTRADYARFGGYLYLMVRAIHPERPGYGLHVHRPSFDEVLTWEEELRGVGLASSGGS